MTNREVINERKKFYPELLSQLPLEIHQIWKIFDDKLRLVGGSVRDLLLKKPVADFDFACTLPPSQTQQILSQHHIKSLPTGLKYGTITALIGNKSFQITTLRHDQNQKGRDCEVEFLTDFAADAARRDFTINALYLCRLGFVYDYFSGFEDLANRKVRFIGEPSQRISEDFLRILRFFRFSCDYALELDSEALQSCIQLKSSLKNLSKERIRGEFLKILNSKQTKQLIQILKIMENSSIASEIFSFEFDCTSLQRLIELNKEFDLSDNFAVKFFSLIGNLRQNHSFFDQKTYNQIHLEICATSSEKRIFTKIRKVSADILNKDARIEIKRLLAREDKNFVVNWLAYFVAKGYLIESKAEFSCEFNHKNPAKFEELQAKIVADFFQMIRKQEIGKFPLNGEDVIRLGIKHSNISTAIFAAKNFLADTNFLATKPEILEFLSKKFT